MKKGRSYVTWVESKEIEKIAARLGRVRLLALRVIDTRGWSGDGRHSCLLHLVTAYCGTLRFCWTRRRLGPWAPNRKYFPLNFHTNPIFFRIRSVQRLDIFKVLFIHQLMHQWVVLKTILKFTLEFTLKQLRHVSVLQLHHHQSTAEQCNIQTPIRTQYMQPHHHRINHTPMYFNGLF